MFHLVLNSHADLGLDPGVVLHALDRHGEDRRRSSEVLQQPHGRENLAAQHTLQMILHVAAIRC